MTTAAASAVARCTFDAATHTYRLDGREVPSVTQVLQLAGLEPVFKIDPATRDLAAQRGTYVHEAAELLDQGRLDWQTLDPVLVPYVRAYDRFRTEKPWTVHASEHLVWTAAFGGCAGTLDRRGLVDGAPAVWDLKTGEDRWQHALQTAGYVLLPLCEEHGGSGAIASARVRAAFRATRRYVVQLRADATYRVIPHDDPDDADDFVAALRVAHVKRRHRERLPEPQPRTLEVDHG